MLAARDVCLVVGTALAVLAYQQSATQYARWKGRRARAQFPLIPAQLPDSDDENEQMDTCGDAVPRRIRKAETVLSRRTSRIVLVLEASCDMFNQQAVLRTAECMGIQHVWIVEPALYKQHKTERHIAREAVEWLSIRRFKTTDACIDALQRAGYAIWATDLSQDAVSLDCPTLTLPDRVAIVMGREADGVSRQMLAAADKRVYLPIHGFADSLNLNVATGMVLLQLFALCPTARGAMRAGEREALRDVWYRRLVKGAESADALIQAPPAPYRDLRRPDDHRGAWMAGKVKRKIVAQERAIRATEQGATTAKTQ